MQIPPIKYLWILLSLSGGYILTLFAYYFYLSLGWAFLYGSKSPTLGHEFIIAGAASITGGILPSIVITGVFNKFNNRQWLIGSLIITSIIGMFECWSLNSFK